MSLLPSQVDIPFRNISKLVLSNSAFVNPYRTLLDLSNFKLAELSNIVNSASAISNPNVFIHATQITTAIASLNTTLGRFGLHTDSLSGVNLSGGLSGANFATISSIVSTVQDYRDDGSICEVVFGAFGAILNLAAIATQIELLLGRIDNILTIPEQIANSLDFLKLLLEQQIVADLNAFAIAQIEALQYAASASINSLINNACVSEILTKIGSQELKNIIREKTSEIF